jgi:hypothetical protein
MKRMSAGANRKGVKKTGDVVFTGKRRSEPPAAVELSASSEDSEESESDKKFLEEEPRKSGKKRTYAGKSLYSLIRISKS